MRKIDYSILASIIRRHRIAAHKLAAGLPGSAEFAEGEKAACEKIADSFAREAAVDRQTFLQACGIDP